MFCAEAATRPFLLSLQIQVWDLAMARKLTLPLLLHCPFDSQGRRVVKSVDFALCALSFIALRFQ